MKEYSVKEVREYTGLTRKQLYDYENGIKPSRRKENKYKIYNQEGLENLCLAAFYAELGAKPKRIIEIFGDEKYDKDKALEELLCEARKERQRIDDIIVVAEYISKYGSFHPLCNPFRLNNLHETAEMMRTEYQQDDYLLYEERMTDEVIINKLIPLCVELVKSGGSLDNPENRVDGAKRIINFITTELDIKEWQRPLNRLHSAFSGMESVRELIDSCTKKGGSDYIAGIISNYQRMIFKERMDKNWNKLKTLADKDLDATRAETTISILLSVMESSYGYNTISEAGGMFRVIYNKKKQNDELDNQEISVWEYIDEALKKHEGNFNNTKEEGEFK